MRPWGTVGIDLFALEGRNYVLLMDYYSHYPEMALLKDTTASQVITHIKSVFARHGVPDVVCTNNCPQFSCTAFSDFAELFGFKHVTSSPLYPQSNRLDSKTDPYLALLNYRATPLKHGLSPAELLFNRKIGTRCGGKKNIILL